MGSKRDCESAELEGAGEEWVGEREREEVVGGEDRG
jgi:hypothetical protein